MSMQAETDPKSEQAKAAASDVADHASEQASQVAGTAKSEARTVVADAKDQAADVLGKSRAELSERASEQTKALSSTLGDLAGQLDTMADGSDDPDAQIARLAKSAAGSMQRSAERLDEGGFDGLLDDVKRFARNRPGAFMLGAVATGFAVGRLAKHADLKQAGEKAKDAATPDDGAVDDAGRAAALPSPPATSGQPPSGRPGQVGAVGAAPVPGVAL